MELDNLAIAYGPRTLFDGLSATVAAGETLVVTGANGAGKSTLLKIIAGLVRPEAGCVRFAGGQDGGAAQNRLQFGYASPDMNMYGELSGLENINFFARLRGLPPGAGTELLAQVGLSANRGKDLVGAYSSGLRQRLKLAVSLLGAPPLLVWDEPTLALDERGAERVGQILDAHRMQGGLAVVATNDAGEAERWADRTLHVGR